MMLSSKEQLNDILTTKEVVGLLRLHPVTASLVATNGEIPGWNVGSRWRFSRNAIMAMLGGQMHSASIAATTANYGGER